MRNWTAGLSSQSLRPWPLPAVLISSCSAACSPSTRTRHSEGCTEAEEGGSSRKSRRNSVKVLAFLLCFVKRDNRMFLLGRKKVFSVTSQPSFLPTAGIISEEYKCNFLVGSVRWKIDWLTEKRLCAQVSLCFPGWACRPFLMNERALTTTKHPDENVWGGRTETH